MDEIMGEIVADSSLMTVAVRSLCEFAARSGSLEFRYTPAPTPIQGIIGHQTVQGRRPDPYVSEYLLTGECEGLLLSGRVDGYYAHQQQPFLEEIKTHRGKVSRIGPGKRALHWAQLKVYGALLCQRDRRDSITLRLTYFEVRSEEETREDIDHSAEELQQFLQALCQRYRRWAEQELAQRRRRDRRLLNLQFPFAEFRHGQRDLSEAVYKSAARGQALLLQAPTGIGKTLGVLFPALSAMPRRDIDRVFFLTCRNTGRELALDGLRQLLPDQEQMPIRILELAAREQSCDHPNAACHGESCPLAEGFFDRLDAARAEAAETTFLDQPALQRIANRHHLCRYFLALEMARWSDVVVGDVNHYFDQHALLYALSQQNGWQVMPVVDEAHNLIDRARSMYSIVLSEAEMLHALTKPPATLRRPLAKLAGAWQDMLAPYRELIRDDNPRYIYLDEVPNQLNDALYSLIAAITDYLSDHPGDARIQQLLFTASGFLRLAERFGDHSQCVLDCQWQTLDTHLITGTTAIRIDNLIPADHLQGRFIDAHNPVLFSATLTPPHFYRDLLGMPHNTACEDIDSPFHRDQIELNLVSQISTRFEQRGHSLDPICDRIGRRFAQRPGNYLVYLSSFSYLQDVVSRFRQRFADIAVVAQHAAMSPRQRSEFIDALRSPDASVGFAVLGGVFAEGIDLPGEQLIGVFVATLGLPPYSESNEVLRQRLDQRFGDGYAYTYLYPGLRKVIQAAGRLIRTPQDRGLIELIDDRYQSPVIRGLLPKWWEQN